MTTRTSPAPGSVTAAVPSPWRVVGLVLGAVAAAAAGVALSGAALPQLLGDPGAVVRWGLPPTTALAELAGALALGGLLLAVCVLPRRTAPGGGRPGVADGRAYPRALVVGAWGAGAWTVLSIARLVLTYGSVAGRSPSAEGFGAELGVFVTQVELGRTLLFITMCAAVVTALALVVQTPTGAAWTVLPVLAALWQQAQLGHASGATGHAQAVSSMALHLVGAAVWIGGLAVLALVVRDVRTDLSAAVARYSVVAGWCFAAVALSGVVNGLLRVDTLGQLGTDYGLLLLTKALLFGVLGLLGLAHRRAVIPRLAGGGRAGEGVARAGGALFWRLVAVELVVMGAVSGVAVALGSTAPPVSDEPPADATPAYQLTGSPLPPEPTAERWFTLWGWDWLLVAAAVAAIVVYVRWVVRLRRRGDDWSLARTASWVAGMLLLGWATSGGPAVYGEVLFSAHMVEHMVLAMVVPVFVVLSAPVTLALRALPARSTRLREDASRGPREWILVLVHSRFGRFVAHPVVAAVVFVASMIAFYYTGLFEWSLRDHVGHLFMTVHFTLAGYLFANAMVGIDPGPSRPPYPQRLLLLFATMAFHAFFGVALISGEALLVADWFGLMGRPWGPSAIVDQQRGGGIAWGIGELPTLALAIGVAVQWARDDERTARRRDRKVDRFGDTEMDDYNAMLGRLAARDGQGSAPD